MKKCIFKNYYKKLNKDNNNGDPFLKESPLLLYKLTFRNVSILFALFELFWVENDEAVF